MNNLLCQAPPRRINIVLLVACLSLVIGLLASPSIMASEFVGAKACASCHESAYQAWQGSHHDMAMKHADENSVLGDFNNYHYQNDVNSAKANNGKSKSDTYNNNASKNRFFMKGDQYWVHIKGANGKYQDFQIKYTFGYTPLQQYMVEFDDGRVQLIPFAWDSRDKKYGGQRWFNLYPEMTKSHQEF